MLRWSEGVNGWKEGLVGVPEGLAVVPVLDPTGVFPRILSLSSAVIDRHPETKRCTLHHSIALQDLIQLGFWVAVHVH